MAGVRLPGGLSADRLLEALSTSVLLTDADTVVCYANAAAESLLGLSRRRMVAQPLARNVADAGDLAGLIRRCGRSGESFGRRDMELTTLAPAAVLVDCSIGPAEEDPGDGARLVLVELHDATSRLRIQRDRALAAQREATRRMIRQLAHEIKNPLGGLRGAAQLLERELPSSELKEYTDVIIGEADRLKALVNQLLGPGGALHRQPLNIHELLQHVLRLVSAEAPPGVTVLRDYDPSLPPVSVDRNQMIQALLNLAKNALEAVGSEGEITLRTRARRNVTLAGRRHRLTVSVEVEDNGPGIPPHLRETVFYPLVTGRDTGSGIGLSLAQEIVNRHGGQIEFDSQPGRTVFRVGLPVEDGNDEG